MLFCEPLERRQLLTAGLGVTYYDNADFTGSSAQRIDRAVSFDWGAGSPSSKISADTFSARWTGKIKARYSEVYNFYATTDDGVRVWVDNKLVIDYWHDRPARLSRGSIAMTAGKRVNLKVEYYDNGGAASAVLSWSSASQVKQVVPTARLSTTQIYPGELWRDTTGNPFKRTAAGFFIAAAFTTGTARIVMFRRL